MIYPKLQTYIAQVLAEAEHIAEDRKPQLREMRRFIRQQLSAQKSPELIFICTHNSRRSHFGQIWAQTLAHYVGITSFKSYSGGTEATVFSTNAIDAIKQAGFRVIQLNESTNPLYRIRFSDSGNGITAFSKIFTHPANPQQDFCAVMTCTDADENCPFVAGALLRISTPYDDPKAYDNTPLKEEMYAARCRQIATELAWVFKGVNV